MLDGHLGKISGGTARVYNTRAQAFEILKRNPEATPVIDVLTYFVDLMLWFNAGNPPREVVARGQMGILIQHPRRDLGDRHAGRRRRHQPGDHLVTGNPIPHATPAKARLVLETTIAIERAVATGERVRLPLET